MSDDKRKWSRTGPIALAAACLLALGGGYYAAIMPLEDGNGGAGTAPIEAPFIARDLDFTMDDSLDDFSDGVLDELSKKMIAPPVTPELRPPPEYATETPEEETGE